MKILITGIAGFAGRHFLNLISKKKKNSLVIGLDRNEAKFDPTQYKNIRFEIFKKPSGLTGGFFYCGVYFLFKFVPMIRYTALFSQRLNSTNRIFPGH